MDKDAVEAAVMNLIEQVSECTHGVTNDRVTITHHVIGHYHHYRIAIYTVGGTRTHHFRRRGRND